MEITPQIIEQCKVGNQQAYSQIYESCARGVFSSIVRIVKNKEEAEDLLQETFISAFQNISKFRLESSLFGWIKKIGINKSLNSIKKRKLDWSEREIENISIVEEDKQWENIELEVSKVIDKMSLLPEGYRVVISLFLFEGYSHKEISEQLQISESTSKSQYVRGKKKLRELLLN